MFATEKAVITLFLQQKIICSSFFEQSDFSGG
jgi:hypothetical protein